MFTIEFEYYHPKYEMYFEDDYECNSSYKEFENWLEEKEITIFTILEIKVL